MLEGKVVPSRALKGRDPGHRPSPITPKLLLSSVGPEMDPDCSPTSWNPSRRLTKATVVSYRIIRKSGRSATEANQHIRQCGKRPLYVNLCQTNPIAAPARAAAPFPHIVADCPPTHGDFRGTLTQMRSIGIVSMPASGLGRAAVRAAIKPICLHNPIHRRSGRILASASLESNAK